MADVAEVVRVENDDRIVREGRGEKGLIGKDADLTVDIDEEVLVGRLVGGDDDGLLAEPFENFTESDLGAQTVSVRALVRRYDDVLVPL